jgi:hypothetical protein
MNEFVKKRMNRDNRNMDKKIILEETCFKLKNRSINKGMMGVRNNAR